MTSFCTWAPWAGEISVAGRVSLSNECVACVSAAQWPSAVHGRTTTKYAEPAWLSGSALRSRYIVVALSFGPSITLASSASRENTMR